MDAYKPAGFWIRFLATVIDSVLIAVLAAIIAVISNDPTYFNNSGYGGENSVSENISGFVYSVVFIIIFTASRYMGSPGKLACRIQVMNTDMTKISMLKSIGRYFAYILSALPLLIGFMMAGWNEEKKALHDIICSTRVVYRKKGN
ncbi:RDD family protein [Virgibacillus sp. C22-A2]|uniref:RDD family protein n=1 Tax=Virgibacillus tibetensis TaxID=3042313 RepID=A0ABU6KG48_9BACI|nr:RDD family protein [Virgibacillus sp. C22-A2]